MTSHGRVCVIGAGASGLAAMKALADRSVPFEAFELGSDVGGLWRYGNDSGRSVAYASLRANTSRSRTAFASFPPPPDWPDFPGHADVLAYLEAFAEKFRLRERIRFRTEVACAMPAGGGWEVTVRDRDAGTERTDRYGAVLVASGHHAEPLLPDLPGRLDGPTLHSSAYRTPDILRRRRVLVVGIGNSACDIACESARVAARIFLSTRRGAHVLPKYLLGRPLDLWVGPLSSRLPVPLRRALLAGLLRLGNRGQGGSGIPVPPYPLGAEHPTISEDLVRLAREGRVVAKPDVERLDGARVRFADGSEEEVDVAIFATGYRVSFPFLADGLVPVEGNRVRLYLRVVPPDVEDLFFIGLAQPLGAIPPLAEAQAEWVADVLAGISALPSAEEMAEEIRRAERERARRFVSSPRHSMEVDYYPYVRALARERRRGRRRAARSRRRTREGDGEGRPGNP